MGKKQSLDNKVFINWLEEQGLETADLETTLAAGYSYCLFDGDKFFGIEK